MQREELFLKNKSLAARERQVTIEVLNCLREIDSRSLHLEAGFRSLHEFVVQYLGYDDGAAWRRINAMRLLREVPELETKIESGAISMTTAAQVAHRLKGQDVEKKRSVLMEMENKSSRENLKILDTIEPPSKPLRSDLDLDDELKELLIKFKRNLVKPN